jgi:hypothetical protein
MAVNDRTPQNTNYIQPTKYLLTFDRIPDTQYFCQSVNIPGISLGDITVPTPVFDYKVAGNKLTYNTFNMTFTIDEPALSWQNLYNWFLAIASPVSINQRNTLSAQQNSYKSQGSFTNYSEAMLTVLSNLNNPIIRVQFHNMFPVSLTDLNFDTTLSADTILTGSATFAYEFFEFLPL